MNMSHKGLEANAAQGYTGCGRLPHVRQHAQEDMLTLERERSSSGKCLGPLAVGRWGALVCEGECVVVRRVGCHVAVRSCDVREGPCGGARAERAQRLAVPECA